MTGDLLRTALASLGAREIELAFDQDVTGWEGTLRLLERLEDDYPALSYLEWSQDHKGPDDAIQAGADFHRLTGADSIRALMEAKIAQAMPRQEPSPANGSSAPRAYNGRDFRAQHWEKPPFLVPELIVPGLTILAGKPKIGKSWLILDLCISLATGSTFLKEKWAVEPCPVLYMALEEVPGSFRSGTEKSCRGRS